MVRLDLGHRAVTRRSAHIEQRDFDERIETGGIARQTAEQFFLDPEELGQHPDVLGVEFARAAALHELLQVRDIASQQAREPRKANAVLEREPLEF